MKLESQGTNFKEASRSEIDSLRKDIRILEHKLKEAEEANQEFKCKSSSLNKKVVAFEIESEEHEERSRRQQMLIDELTDQIETTNENYIMVNSEQQEIIERQKEEAGHMRETLREMEEEIIIFNRVTSQGVKLPLVEGVEKQAKVKQGINVLLPVTEGEQKQSKVKPLISERKGENSKKNLNKDLTSFAPVITKKHSISGLKFVSHKNGSKSMVEKEFECEMLDPKRSEEIIEVRKFLKRKTTLVDRVEEQIIKKEPVSFRKKMSNPVFMEFLKPRVLIHRGDSGNNIFS